MHNAALQLHRVVRYGRQPTGHSMLRRDFISLLSSAATSWPLAARAQQPTKVPLLGYLTGDSVSADLPRRNAFQQGLRDLGYNEGQNIFVEYRTAAGSSGFQRLQMNLHVSTSMSYSLLPPRRVQVAAKAMPTKPIVSITPDPSRSFVGVSDPVGSRIVTNLARPGGNITGFQNFEATIGGKWLDVLREIAPGIRRVVFVHSPDISANVEFMRAAEAASSRGARR